MARLDEHRGIIFKIANSYCPGGEERDDLVQEICLQLWRSYASYDPERRFSTWMYRVALNTAISFARATRRREGHTVPLDESQAGEAAEVLRPHERDERVAELYRVLHSLSELDRALVLLYLEERSYREIAEVLGISETNVGTRLGRLKQRMRRDLGAQRETEDGP
jgi:RNA polymerase sigma-70 factor (ECF subfamily)